MNVIEQNQLRQRALGRAPVLARVNEVDHGLDLQLLRGGTGKLDLAFVSGIGCLTQALTLALTTALGSDVFNVRFGFDGLNAIAFEADPILARERVRVAVIQTMKVDPRVKKILDVQFDEERSSDERERRILKINAQFETVTGDVLTLGFSRISPNG